MLGYMFSYQSPQTHKFFLNILHVFRVGTWLTIHRPLDMPEPLGDSRGAGAGGCRYSGPSETKNWKNKMMQHCPKVSLEFDTVLLGSSEQNMRETNEWNDHFYPVPNFHRWVEKSCLWFENKRIAWDWFRMASEWFKGETHMNIYWKVSLLVTFYESFRREPGWQFTARSTSVGGFLGSWERQAGCVSFSGLTPVLVEALQDARVWDSRRCSSKRALQQLLAKSIILTKV